jgi:hypothetical protein
MFFGQQALAQSQRTASTMTEMPGMPAPVAPVLAPTSAPAPIMQPVPTNSFPHHAGPVLPVAIPYTKRPDIGAPSFVQAGAWVVKPNQMSEVRGLDNVDLPCMMVTSFDNGYSLRFSGSKGKILAMAVDFRQEIFVRGRKYSGVLALDDGVMRNVSATAFTNSTLIFNMREVQGFYGAVSASTGMLLNVENNPMIFRLSGMVDAMQKLEACYIGKPFSNVRSVSASGGALPVPPQPLHGQSVNNNKSWTDKVEPVPARIARDHQKTQRKAGQVWQAQAGNSVRSTLQSWADRAGVDVDWNATGDLDIIHDITVHGSFEDAVQALMAQNAAALGIDANMVGKTGHMRPTALHRAYSQQGASASRAALSSSMTSVASSRPSSQTTNYVTGGRWSAETGASLQSVLQNWSKKAGVELMWESGQGFAVRSPISTNASYEDALRVLLEQYSDQRVRPQAQLNNDPNTGRRVLFIQASRV